MADAESIRDVHGFPGPTIDITAVEQELSNIWRLPNVARLRGSDLVPTRTSVLNLVIFASSVELADRSNRIINQLASHHPSRAILFTTTDDPRALEGTLDARVSTHCVATGGERFAACFDQVTITLPPDPLEYLPSLVAPLALPDLPTFAWWPGQPPLADPRVARFARSVDRLIVDSLEFKQVPANLVRLAEVCRRVADRSAITDLNWARLGHWREMTAQIFDLREGPWALTHITQIAIEYGQATGQTDNPAQALLYAGWLNGRLGWRVAEAGRPERDRWSATLHDPQGRAVTLQVRRRTVPRAYSGYLLAVQLTAADGEHTGHFTIARTGDLATIMMQAQCGEHGPIEQGVHAPPPDLRGLLARELELGSHDRLYEEAIHEAARLAAYIRNRGR